MRCRAAARKRDGEEPGGQRDERLDQAPSTAGAERRRAKKKHFIKRDLPFADTIAGFSPEKLPARTARLRLVEIDLMAPKTAVETFFPLLVFARSQFSASVFYISGLSKARRR